VIRHPIFWLMYLMFVIVGAGGLMVTANLKPIAVDWKIDNVPVTLMAMTMTAVTFAATLDRILNGLTRPFFGWVSDMIGRENTMFIAFGLEGIGIWALYMLGHDPVWFVVLSGMVFFAWGEIYSLFPSTCTDTFGAKFATTNAGLLYTAKGTAALLVPVANYMQQSSGSWDRVFLIAAGANILASLLAIAVLKPWWPRLRPLNRATRLFQKKRAHPTRWARFFWRRIPPDRWYTSSRLADLRPPRLVARRHGKLLQNVSITAYFCSLCAGNVVSLPG
jgi:OFA family oxalate/formate antiporter-like MFS transporter